MIRASCLSRPPIDLAVVGGYLGAGKTTVVNGILARPHGKRIAVLVNDFGAVNIDARLIRERSDDVIELDNGCICCTIGGALSDALARVAERDEQPDLLLIEASGVSDPAKIAQIGMLNGAFRLTVVLVAADALELSNTLADPLIGTMARKQIDSASAVVVTKLDLLESDARARAMADVRALASTDIVVAADRGRIAPELLFDGVAQDRPCMGTGLWNGRGPAMPAFSSFSLAVPEVLEKSRLRTWLKALPRTILRAKGIVPVADQDGGIGMRVCQIAARRLRLTAAEGVHGDRGGMLVFIGLFDAQTETLLREGLDACRWRPARHPFAQPARVPSESLPSGHA